MNRCSFEGCTKKTRGENQRYCDEHHAKANKEYRQRVKKQNRTNSMVLNKVVNHFTKHPEELSDGMKSILSLLKQ